MTAFLTLLKREWLEAKVPFFWVQVGLLAFMILISTLVLSISGFNDLHNLLSAGEEGAAALTIDRWTDQELAGYLMMARSMISAPFFGFYAIAAIFVLLGALHDDRKDRSVLFWKSMPVTDYETVASKLVLAVWIAPLVAIAAVVIAQIFFLIVVSSYVLVEDLGSVGRLWWQSGIVTGAFQLVLGILIQGFWTLPIWAWLLFISALVPRLPLMWAILIPLVPIVAEFILFRSNEISLNIAKHAEAAAMPNLSDNDRIMPLAQTVSDQLALLATPDLWLGVLLGLALLYGAVRLRELKNEI
jgi:ABC-2 type transport system permease protein